MASNEQVAIKASESLGLNTNKKTSIGFGLYNGYTMIIKRSYNLNGVELLMCAQRNGAAPTQEMIVTAGLPKGVKLNMEGFMLAFFIGATTLGKTSIERIVQSAETATAVLAREGFENCSSKGTAGYTDIYLLGNKYVFLTDSDANELTSELSTSKIEYDNIVEDRVRGVVGGLLGSLAGVAVILILGRFNLVSDISGIVMGLVSVFGYKKLGHKLSWVGAIFCTIISVAMSFLAYKLNAAITLANALKDVEEAAEVSFGMYFLYSKDFYEVLGELDTYNFNMLLTMLLSVGGAAIAIWQDKISTKKGFELKKIGE